MKKFFLCLLTALTSTLSSLTYAEQAVVVPTLEGGLTASIGTFYVVPSVDNESYSILHTGSPNENSDVVVNLNPDYDFGFEASLGYIFVDTANGIELSYRGLNTNNMDSLFLSGDKEETAIDSNLNYNFNAFDLMVSQFIDVGTHMQLRLNGGLAYVELKQKQQTSLFQIFPDSSSEHDLTDQSKFTGWGPRVGIDTRYEFGPGFGIIGNGSLAYYLGELNLNSSLVDIFPNEELTNNLQDDLDNHAVANLRANLGIDYVYFFDNEKHSTVGIELGYLIDYYNDAVGNINSTEFTTQDGEPAQLFALSFSGPYLNVKGAF